VGRRQLQRLSAKEVNNKRTPGYYPDGGGLYLQISPVRTKSWIFRFTLFGRSREMGLGSLNTVGLAEARTKASECRKLLLDKIDPIAARDTEHAQKAVESARSVTFAECARRYIETHRAGWKNEKHADQWTNTLETYAGPVIGKLPVAEIDTSLVVKVLEPIWSKKTETASRVRGRIESVLDWARVRGYRQGENPARWRGHLDKILPKRSKVAPVVNHAALPYADLAEFMIELRKQEGTAARALEFTILTAARTGEVIGAVPGELDFSKAVWNIPAARMKARKPHSVPLPLRAVEIVEEQVKLGGTYVFPGQKDGEPLSNMAMLALLERMGRDDITVHGFRSTFKDWAAECTAFSNHVSEKALAHIVGDRVEAAYRRGELFEKRRQLMMAWAKFCGTRPRKGEVVPIRRKRL
jgi:integrase